MELDIRPMLLPNAIATPSPTVAPAGITILYFSNVADPSHFLIACANIKPISIAMAVGTGDATPAAIGTILIGDFAKVVAKVKPKVTKKPRRIMSTRKRFGGLVSQMFWKVAVTGQKISVAGYNAEGMGAIFQNNSIYMKANASVIVIVDIHILNMLRILVSVNSASLKFVHQPDPSTPSVHVPPHRVYHMSVPLCPLAKIAISLTCGIETDTPTVPIILVLMKVMSIGREKFRISKIHMGNPGANR